MKRALLQFQSSVPAGSRSVSDSSDWYLWKDQTRPGHDGIYLVFISSSQEAECKTSLGLRDNNGKKRRRDVRGP